MNRAQILALQIAVSTPADGFWGPKSTAAAKSHLRRIMDAATPKWPASDQASLRDFYGRPGDEDNLTGLPAPEGVIVHYEGKPVQTIRCHKRVAESLRRVLISLAAIPDGKEILLDYAGCFNNRSIRGGTTPSLHSYGAAIDFAPGDNGNHTHWPTGATMPLAVMECFAREGWLAAGAFWSRDAMHFQATR